MITLKESLLGKTNVKVKGIRGTLGSLGNVFSLERIKIFPTFGTAWYLDQLNGQKLSSIVGGRGFLTRELEDKIAKLNNAMTPERHERLTDFFKWLDNVDVSDLGGKPDPDALVDILSANVVADDLIYKYNTTYKGKGICFCYIDVDEECVIQLRDGGVRLCEITVRER